MADANNAELKKKCAQTGVNLKRKKRYYRNGRYFVTKAAFKTKQKTEQAASAAVAEEAK